MLVYISCNDIETAKEAAHFAIEKGNAPIVPQMLTGSEAKRTLAVELGLVHLEECEEVWVFFEEGVSKAMATEIERAKKNDIKIRYFEANKLSEYLA